MLRASGLKDDDFTKPLIGVANTWIEIGPCNYHLRELAQHVKDGIRKAGGTPLEFNTVSISDGITMGTEGMKASLISREVIADSIELVTRGNLFDALVVLVGCDKTIPGGIMALARLDIPAANSKAIPSPFKMCTKPLARIPAAKCPTRVSSRWKNPLARAPVPASANSLRTRWPLSANFLESLRSASPAFLLPTQAKPQLANALAKWF